MRRPPAEPAQISFAFEGADVSARPGQSIGAALWKAGVRQFRTTRRLGRPRGLYCGIGQCFDCLVRVNDGPPVRACVTAAVAGATVAAGDHADEHSDSGPFDKERNDKECSDNECSDDQRT